MRMRRLFPKLFSSLMVVTLFSAMTATSVSATEIHSQKLNSPGVVVEIFSYNEYEAAMEAARTSRTADSIEDVHKQFSDYVYELQANKTETELAELGYSDEQISLIKNYDGSQDIVSLFSASVSVTNSVSNYKYNSSTNKTSADIKFGFTWNGTAAHIYEDVLAVAWSEGFYCTSTADMSITCTYKSNRNDTKMSFSAPSSSPSVKKDTVNTGNTSAKFTFDKHFGSRMRLYSATGTVHLEKTGRVPEFSVLVSYGEAQKSVSPSFSVSAGGPSVSVSFVSGVSEIAKNLSKYSL